MFMNVINKPTCIDSGVGDLIPCRSAPAAH